MRHRVISLVFTALCLPILAHAADPASPQPAANAAPPRKLEQVLAKARAMPLDRQRYLVYLYTRLGRADVATALGEAIIDKHPSDRETLIELASVYSITKKQGDLSRIVAALKTYYPGERSTRYYEANLKSLRGDLVGSRQILMEIGPDAENPESVGMLLELASIHSRSGDWPRAVHAYKELLESEALDDELRSDAREILDSIVKEEGGWVQPRAEYNELESGVSFINEARAETPLDARTRIGATVRHQQIDIEDAIGLRGGYFERVGAVADIRYLLAKDVTATARVGGHDGGATAGAALAKAWRSNKIEASCDWNRTSSEGLLFEALNGREDRLALQWTSTLFKHYTLTLEPSIRQLRVDDSDIAKSYGITGGIERQIWRHGVDISVAYRASFFHSDPDEPSPSSANPVYLKPRPAPEPEEPEAEPAPAEEAAVAETPVEEAPPVEDAIPVPTVDDEKRQLLSGLMTDETQRHGLYITFQGDITTLLRWRIQAGSDYVLETDSFEYSGGGGITFTPCKSVECSLDTLYSTSGGGSNQGSTLKQAALAFKWWF